MSTNSKRTTRRDKFKFPFELSEEQIAVKLGFYFGLLESGLGVEFELESSDEARTGADHEYEGIAARYYLQAKSPIGLLGTETVALKEETEQEKGLNAIRKFRKENNLREEPYSLCFPLRRPAKHAKVPDELQHNLLYAMHDDSQRSYAMYVAPTTHEKSEYMRLLRDKTHWDYLHDGPFWKFSSQRVMLDEKIVADVFMNMPFLQAHICIVPHTKVESHEHYYSYSVHGNDVAFHSPTILDGSSINLSDFLARQHRINSIISDEKIQPIDAVVDIIKSALPQSFFANMNSDSQESRIRWIRKVGEILKKEYGIHQYLLMKKKK